MTAMTSRENCKMRATQAAANSSAPFLWLEDLSEEIFSCKFGGPKNARDRGTRFPPVSLASSISDPGLAQRKRHDSLLTHLAAAM